MSKVIKKISLIEQVKNLLKEDITSGILQPGQRIESIRSLLKKYKVSHITAATALKQLSQEGWVNSKVGSGSFVSAAPPVESFKPVNPLVSLKKNLYFIITGDNSQEGYHSKVLKYLQELVAEYKLQLKLVSADDSETLEKITSDPKTLGIICTAETKIIAANIPIVYYGMSPVDTDSCFVQPDNFQAGILSGEILSKYGHRNIRYVSGDIIEAPGRLHFVQRYNGLCAACEIASLDHPGFARWHIKVQESRQELIHLLEQIKERDPEAPTALVIGNNAMASEIYMVAIGMGIRIPEDLSIISFIDRTEYREDHISTIDFSRKAMAEQLLSIILSAKDSSLTMNKNKHLLAMFLSNPGSIKDLNQDNS